MSGWDDNNDCYPAPSTTPNHTSVTKVGTNRTRLRARASVAGSRAASVQSNSSYRTVTTTSASRA